MAFARARAVLAAELGVDPGPELQQLHQRVLAQDPRLTRQRHHGVPPELRRTDGALVGREVDLAVLRDLWDGVRRSGTTRVLLRSPAGGGALRLVSEIAQGVAANGGEVVFVGRSDPAPALTTSSAQVLVVVDRGAEVPALDDRHGLVPPSAEADPGTVALDLDPLDREGIRRVRGTTWRRGSWTGRRRRARPDRDRTATGSRPVAVTLRSPRRSPPPT